MAEEKEKDKEKREGGKTRQRKNGGRKVHLFLNFPC